MRGVVPLVDLPLHLALPKLSEFEPVEVTHEFVYELGASCRRRCNPVQRQLFENLRMIDVAHAVVSASA